MPPSTKTRSRLTTGWLFAIVGLGTLVLIAVFAGLFVLKSHLSRDIIPIHRGYSLVMIQGLEPAVCDQHQHGVIPEGVTLCGVCGDLIIGQVQPVASPGPPFPPGFFVLNTNSGGIKAGLTEAQLSTATGQTNVMSLLQTPEAWAWNH